MAGNASRLENEHSKLYKVLNFRLPHRFKALGIIGAVLLMVFLVLFKYWGSNSLIAKDAIRTIILLCLLVSTLSKDKFEDEYNTYLRYHSFVIAFVLAVAYSIFLPLITLVFDVFITKITGDGMVNFHEVSAFEVLFMLLGFQLLFFETLKRFDSAQ